MVFKIIYYSTVFISLATVTTNLFFIALMMICVVWPFVLNEIIRKSCKKRVDYNTVKYAGFFSMLGSLLTLWFILMKAQDATYYIWLLSVGLWLIPFMLVMWAFAFIEGRKKKEWGQL